MKYLIIFLVSCVAFITYADNRSDQMNPNNDAYYQSRGYDERPDDWNSQSYSSSTYSRSYSAPEYNNRSNQLNPNNDAYWKSRGHDDRSDEGNNTITQSNKSHEYNNRSNQLNSNNNAYWKSRGDKEKDNTTLIDNENRSKQLNPNNSAYWKSRGVKITTPVETQTINSISIAQEEIENKTVEPNQLTSYFKTVIHFLSIR